DGVGERHRAIVGDPLLEHRRKLGASANRDADDRYRYRGGERLEGFMRAVRSGRLHALDEGHGVAERDWPRPGAAQIASHRPSALVMIRMRGQIVREVDTPPIEELAAGRNRDKDRRVAVLDGAHRRRLPQPRFRHTPLRRCSLIGDRFALGLDGQPPAGRSLPPAGPERTTLVPTGIDTVGSQAISQQKTKETAGRTELVALWSD